MEDEFERLFTRVFDENNQIKRCGRDACIELIEYVENTYNIEVGREKQGIIDNRELIIDLYNNRK